ncbi:MULTISPECIES: hypothetical protein [Flavobacterium]|uniref:hypothetical protein n=1 Tax=Flavobacterium TaxID=237 RepID=UPI002114914E|nr:MULTISPECIES: hypothetical protein [Flavobacterium]UUF13248.1 hypothetical protein NLJ00_18470 [Flavobacterium panici]
MYTLYYLNRNYQIRTIKTAILDTPIRIPEDLVFCNLRKGINFIKEPHRCIDFTDTERLIMASEFTDMSTLKDHDFRKQNTYLTPLCPIDVPDIIIYDEDVFYYNDEGNVLVFPQHEDLPNTLTNVYLSYDGVNYEKIGSEVDGDGFYWNDVQRLYYATIQTLVFTNKNLVSSDDIPTYVFFENALNGKRTKVFQLEIP